MAIEVTTNDVLCYYTAVRSTTPKDNNVCLLLHLIPTSEAVLRAKNTIFSICKEIPITRIACANHSNTSTEHMKDTFYLIERKSANI